LRDAITTAVLLVSFATLVTLHVVIAWKLARTKTPWRAAIGFVLPPLAPVYAFREGFRRLAATWVAVVALYATALFLEQL
jgi:hypothetical protein